MALSFIEVDVPKGPGGPGRKATPSPYLDTVKGLTVGGKALSATVPTLKDARDAVRDLKRAGEQYVGEDGKPVVTVRTRLEIGGKKVADDTSATAGPVTLTFWVVKKIVHNATETPTEGEQSEAEQKDAAKKHHPAGKKVATSAK